MREKTSAQRLGKKRKASEDLEAERTLHHSFVSAANSISQLFTQSVQQQKKAHTAGARQALVSVLLSWPAGALLGYVWPSLELF